MEYLVKNEYFIKKIYVNYESDWNRSIHK
jgi:hypothetical protein